MGVYIIKSKYSNWIKIGHHKITNKRPTVYHRYIRRGFNSCKKPYEIIGRVNFDDLELLKWYNELNIQDETDIHTYLRNIDIKNVGEWYYDIGDNLLKITDYIENNYKCENKLPSPDELELAIQWMNKHTCK